MLILALGVVGPTLAHGQHDIRYSRERGGSCTAMVPYYGPQRLWIGQVAGGRALDVSAEQVYADRQVVESCFFLQADCERWVVTIAGQLPQPPRFAFCRALSGGVNGGARGPAKP